LTLTLNSEGFRYVGDSIEPYGDGDLVLMGANLPHSWHSERAIDTGKPHIAKVAWFDRAWIETLITGFPELHRVADLLAKAQRGIVFSAETAASVRSALEQLPSLPDDERLISLLSSLQKLSRDPGARLLAPASTEEPETREPRLDRVLHHLHQRYNEPIAIAVLAELANMTESGFHRLFRRHMRVPPLQYVARLRIGHACALLIEGKLKILAIAATVGYENLAQCNKEFRRQKGITPRQFAQKSWRRRLCVEAIIGAARRTAFIMIWLCRKTMCLGETGWPQAGSRDGVIPLRRKLCQRM
jgi:AraC-like DNA-binding protein